MPNSSKRTVTRDLISCALGLIAILLLLEVGMRIAGRGMLAEQEGNNEIQASDAQAIRIVAIGASTTADIFTTKDAPSWPRQLERKLQDQGVKVRVYNLGRVAATTSQILERLPEQLDRFQPHLAIAMMGTNDDNNLIVADSSWWNSLRVVRFYHRLRLSMRRPPDEFPPKNFDDGPTTQQVYSGLRSANPLPTIDLVEKNAQELEPIQRAQYYFYIGRILFAGEKDSDHKNSTDFYKRSLATKFQGGSLLTETMYEYIRTENDEECLKLAEIYAGHDWVVSDFLLRRFSQCALISLKKASPLVENWKKLFETVNPGFNFDEVVRGEELSIASYRATYRLLKKRNITLIAMQFPTLPIQTLKDFFTEGDFQDIIFAENKTNFDEALKKYGSDKVFTDKFNNFNFGHTTGFGHSLIADTAAKAVSEYLRRRK
jgi:hypothetical protein